MRLLKYWIWLFSLGIVATSIVFADDTDQDAKVEYEIKYNISYRDDDFKNDYAQERCKLDIYYPANKNNFATIVWFHGGGLSSGEKFIPEELKNHGLAVIAVNYRLYPQAHCPAYIDDAAAAVAWTFKNISEYGGDSNLIFVAGHSAGGYLTSMIGMDKKYLNYYGIDADRIAALIPFSGHAITHFTVRKERGIPETRPIIDDFAPLFHVRKDAPPLILITGDRNLEMLGRYEENAYMMRMMKVVGHKQTEIYEIKDHDHGQMVKPACQILLDTVKKIIKKRIT